jgi:digeranylgeranylglycerophospholipid reductase
MLDLVIVGAGPCGLMAARGLPKTISFIVIDQKAKIGLPLRCGEGIREKEFIRLFRQKKYPFVRNTVREHEVIYKNIKRRFKAEYLQLDRPLFENWLAKPIMKRIKLNTRCEEIEVEKDFVEIKTKNGRIKAKCIILANGPDFNIQKKLGLTKKNPLLFVCYGGIYKNHGLNPNRFYAYFDDKYFGYLWIFPKNKELANAGFGSIKRVNVKRAFTEILKRVNPNMKKVSSYSGIVPCGGPIEKTYHNRVLVAGDAAGMVYAGTGEGIYFALESGRIAGRFAKKAVEKERFDEEFLKGYEKEWKRSFGKLMHAGIVFKDLQYVGYKSRQMKELFKRPTNRELRMIISEGSIPLRAKIAWKLFKLIKMI